MSFKAELRTSLGWNWDDGAVDNRRLDCVAQLLEGNGSGQAEAAWISEDQALQDTASVTLDLDALTRAVLGDQLTVSFETIKALLIRNADTSTGNLVIGNAATNEWSAPLGAAGDTLVVPPDGVLLTSNRDAGWTVDATHKNLKLAASGGNLIYSIAVLGTTTAP
ncbi:hypothetical protein ES707_09505 [subsurface metagenome]